MSAFKIDTPLKLASGHTMPLLGFGLYQTPADEAEKATAEALKAGYRQIDDAQYYANEAGAGKAIRESGIPREQIFFTSKVSPANFTYEGAKAAVAHTLSETGLDYIDLMLLHAPFGGSANRKGCWRALVEAVEEGKVRSIGVSNYGVHHLDQLLEHIKELEAERGGPGKGGVLSVGQWELHPWLARPDIVSWCQKHNVAIQAYSPLLQGKRWGDPTLKALAEKHGVTEAQILLRWSLDKGFSPLPKSVTPARIKANTDLFGFSLTPEEVAQLETDKYFPIGWDPTLSGLEDPLPANPSQYRPKVVE